MEDQSLLGPQAGFPRKLAVHTSGLFHVHPESPSEGGAPGKSGDNARAFQPTTYRGQSALRLLCMNSGSGWIHADTSSTKPRLSAEPPQSIT